jgi:tetratricopeptide (TPR) repeat protein
MEKLSEYLQDEDKLVSPITLIIGISAILTSCFAADGVVEKLITASPRLRLLIYALLIGSWVIFWAYKRHELPRTIEGKAGILLAIQTDSNEAKKRLKADLVKRMNDLIIANGLYDIIDVVLTTNYQAAKYTPLLDAYRAQSIRSRDLDDPVSISPKLEKEWFGFRKRVRSILYVWGDIKQRTAKEETYFIETNAIIIHGPITKEQREEVSNDVVSIWSPQFSFPASAEYDGFRLSGEYLYIEAKYLIGIAAYVYGDYDIAVRMHEGLESEITALIHNHPNFEKIQGRLKKLLTTEHHIIAYRYYMNDGNLQKAVQHNNKALKYNPKDYSCHILKAALEFLCEGNPQRALKTIHAAKTLSNGDGTWRYSEAFLLLQLGKIPNALIVYKDIARQEYEGEEKIVEQVYEFNTSLLKHYPEQIGSHFILSFIDFHKLDDLPDALKHIELFLEKAKETSWQPLIKEANNLKRDIEREMELLSK